MEKAAGAGLLKSLPVPPCQWGKATPSGERFFNTPAFTSRARFVLRLFAPASGDAGEVEIRFSRDQGMVGCFT